MTEVKYYTVRLTEEEIMTVEDALYERASVLYAIGTQLLYKKNKAQSVVMDNRAKELEKLASKIAYPIDVEYIAKYNGNTVS